MSAETPNSGQPAVQPCRYKVGKTLGAGSYSVVKECVHIDTGRYYAAKVINKRLMAGREHMVRNEIAVLKKVSMGHQNILTLVDYFETMNNLYLVTDLALGGELFDRICRKGSYYEADTADLIRAVLSAVAYLHDHGIVHRDLKPENLLFRTPEDNADLLIADFGLSRIMDEEQFHVLTTTCGTPGYMAPEIFKKTGHGKPVDLWALGVITYFLLCGYTPFDRDTDFEEMQAILAADYSFTPVDYWRGVSDAAKDFIRRCLTVDPAKRMTAHEALQHPFVAGWAQKQAEAAASNAEADKGQDLLPTVRKNFNARRTLHAAIDTVRAINKLREVQNLQGRAKSREPPAARPQNAGVAAAAVAAAAAAASTAGAALGANGAASSNGNGNGNNSKSGSTATDSSVNTAEGSTGATNTAATSMDNNGATDGLGVPGLTIMAPGSTVVSSGARKDDSAISLGRGGSGGGRGSDGSGDDVMTDAPDHQTGVPASLRPGSESNRVMETSKGLWNGMGIKR